MSLKEREVEALAGSNTDHLFPPFPVPEDLQLLAKERGWPDGILQRLVDLKVGRQRIESWLEQDDALNWLERWTTNKERLQGSLRARKADVSDTEGFAELWANSSIDVGDWEVTVERSPNAFAQWRLQENVVINVLEDRGLVVASQAMSRRNTFVGGKPLTVGLMQAVRVRKEFRRRDYSQLVMGGGGGPHPNSPIDNASYFYIRAQNFTAFEWMKALRPDAFSDMPEREGDVPGIDVWILLYPTLKINGDTRPFVDPGIIRRATAGDLSRCVSLINRTHRSLDLFRPYSVESLELRLDEGFWADKPEWWSSVYGWDDFYVLEEEGRVVACAGLWDRGRDMREVWRKKDGSDEKVIAATGLMDFGFASGRETAMAGLIEFLLTETKKLGRDYLMAPLQFLPKVARLLEVHEPIKESRALSWATFDANYRPVSPPDPPLTRPYTDLGYW